MWVGSLLSQPVGERLAEAIQAQLSALDEEGGDDAETGEVETQKYPQPPGPEESDLDATLHDVDLLSALQSCATGLSLVLFSWGTTSWISWENTSTSPQVVMSRGK